ncbi:MAG: OmpA family protein [Planctomycetales bacterium]|nr:OmpA family protein [Planctomycetales bacterium]
MIKLSHKLITAALLLFGAVGCTPRQGGFSSNTSSFGQANPNAAEYANAPGAAGGRIGQALQSLRPKSRTNVSSLYARAKEQERLAAEQQNELNRLKNIQSQYEKMLANLEQEEVRTEQSKLAELAKSEQTWQQRAKTAMGRYQELGNRAKGLDLDNRELQARLAETQKQYQLLTDQNSALRQQLRETIGQLDSATQSAVASDERLKTLQASTQARGGVRITANNSLRRKLTAVTAEGLEVRQDGELVRIVLPSDQVFRPGTATLLPGSEQLIDRVGDVLLQNYSNQIIGVESHTDSSRLDGSLWRNSHHLTSAQAMAVFEQLSYRHRLLPQQLFVLGHGSNYPLVSNGTAAGQARNRRVEIVIYPESVSSRR